VLLRACGAAAGWPGLPLISHQPGTGELARGAAFRARGWLPWRRSA